jgi:Ca2+-binding RTX toxin-like protein
MIRTAALPAAVLLGLTLLTPAVATAAGETCQGQPATVVGAPATFVLTGTEGPDVIVTNGSMQVDALGGDDLVCVTVRGAQVQAGDGDDVVDTAAVTQLPTSAYLGAGSDRFIGGPERDIVYAGASAPGSLEMADTERDVIDTGPATSSPFDQDRVTTGQRGSENVDEIRTDRGSVSWAGFPAAGTVLDGGTGSTLGLRPAEGEFVTLDNRAQVLTVDQQAPLRFTGFTGFAVVAETGPRSFDFRGSSRDETLSLELWDARVHDVRMGGGDDTLRYQAPGLDGLPGATSHRGGGGRDHLELTLPDEVAVDLDLSRGRLATGRRDGRAARATGFEDATVMARNVALRGTASRNKLSVYACRSTVEGRAGRDKLSTFDEVMDESLRCRRPRTRMFGGPGNDVMLGTRGPDVLLGGPGRDRADGAKGRDVCRAEVRKRCEVRR